MHLASLAATGTRSAVLSAGDLLDVRIVSGLEEKPPEPLVLQVSDHGQVSPPLIGPVVVGGMKLQDASRAIAAAAQQREVYRAPVVTVEVRQQATHQVTVLGAVADPGVHELPVGVCDVLSALAAAGGLTEEAGTEIELMRKRTPHLLASAEGEADEYAEVRQASFEGPPAAYPPAETGVHRGAPLTERLDLALASDLTPSAQRLGDRDVIMVPPRQKRRIHVSGLVERPDQFDMPNDQDVRLLDAIALAGGLSSPVADRVVVIRQFEGEAEPVVVEASIAKAKRDGQENLVLRPGDLVSVESTVATTTVDVVERFFRVSLGVTSTLFAF